MPNILSLVDVEHRKLTADALTHYADSMRASVAELEDCSAARGGREHLLARAREAEHLSLQLNQSIGVL